MTTTAASEFGFASPLTTDAFRVKVGLAELLKGGVIMDVVDADPAKRARAIVEATTHFQDPARIAKASEGLGEGMKGIEAAKLSEAELLQTRGW